MEDSGGDKKDSVRTDVPKGLPSQVIPPTYVLNEVRAIVYGPASTALILTLDIKPTLERRPRNLRNLVLEELMLIEARKMKMPITEEDVDRNLKQIQKLANYTMEQITQLFATLGYSLKEAKEQIRRREILERLISFKVRSNKAATITSAEIEEYWNDNPEKEEAGFVLQIGTLKSEKPLTEIESTLKKGPLQKKIDWSAPFTVKDSELAQDKQFIRRKRPGDIVLIEPEGNGYEVTKLVSRIHERNKPFRSGDPDVDNEREMSIKRILGEQRFNKLKRDYEEELLEKAHIVFTYEADRKEVYSPRK